MSRFRACSERGSVAVIVAVMMGALLLLAALVVSAGEWFTHKRQLQTRADAGATAAGVEYGTKWAACVGGDAAARQAARNAIISASRQYSGDPNAEIGVYDPLTAPPVNTEIADQSKLDVWVNSTSYDGPSYTDGGDPCVNHAPDDISPVGGYWTDVRVKERDFPSVFGLFGLPLARNTARARVEIRPALSDNQFVPLAVPEQKLFKAQIRYYDYCDPNAPVLRAKADLSQLESDYQTVSGTTLWGPALNGSQNDPDAVVVPSSIALTIPPKAGCTQDYVPIGVEVRVAGRNVNIDTPTCGTLAAGRFTDCWSRISEIRAWKSGGSGPDDPVFKSVSLSGGTCAPDAYFSRAADCTASVSVDANWGDLDDSPLNSAPGNFVLKIEGQNLTPPSSCCTGVWTSPGTVSVGNAGGGNTIDLTYSWEDKNPSHSWRGSNCKDKGNNPCKIPTETIRVHRTFTGTDANVGTVDLVRTSAASQPQGQPPQSPLDNTPAPDTTATTITIFPTVGLRSSLRAGQFRILRASGPQGNQSLDCEPTGGQGHDFQMFLNGCQPFYGPNSFTDGTWWNTTTQECPRQNVIFSQPNPPPWECVPAAPGFSQSVMADGIAARTGNCDDIQNNSCRRTICAHPNEYDEWLAGTSTDQARIIKLFIVPYGAFKGVNAQDGLPISDFAAFYVTGWGGNGANDDPCTGDDAAQAGEIVGYFIEFVGPNIGPVDPNATCVVGQIRPCRAVLVR